MPIRTRPIRDAIDTTLGVLKWPVALIALIAVVPAVLAWIELVGRIIDRPAPVLWFTGGILAYCLIWWFLLRRRFAGSWLSTLEHEMTHAIVAWLTFHPVTGLRVTWSRGGSMSYRGKGNWLIAIAPYFLPTLSLLLLTVLWLIPARYVGFAQALLGASLAYHAISTIRETHSEQTDLKQVTYLFAALFLPAANLLSLGLILAFAHAGRSGAIGFLTSLVEHTHQLIQAGLRLT